MTPPRVRPLTVAVGRRNDRTPAFHLHASVEGATSYLDELLERLTAVSTTR